MLGGGPGHAGVVRKASDSANLCDISRIAVVPLFRVRLTTTCRMNDLNSGMAIILIVAKNVEIWNELTNLYVYSEKISMSPNQRY